MRGAPAFPMLLLLSAVVAAAGGGGGGAVGPAFARRRGAAVRARAGGAAALRCRVLRLADRAVSWVRSRDLQILTHAGTVFTADARVAAITGEAADTALPPRAPPAQPGGESDGELDEEPEESWSEAEPGGGSAERRDETVHTLRIERLRTSDSGRYECQINTEPKMSLFFNLTVTDSRQPEVEVRALGGRAAAGVLGGAVTLACEARYPPPPPAPAPPGGAAPPPPHPPLHIRWHHADRLLDDKSPPGGVALSAERWAGGARSRLTLGALRRRHAGAWRCSAAAASDTITLSVAPRAGLDDMDSMQRDQAEARMAAGAHALLPVLLPALLPVLLPALLPVLLPAHILFAGA